MSRAKTASGAPASARARVAFGTGRLSAGRKSGRRAMERHGEGAGPGARQGTAPLYAGGITFGHKRPKLHSSGLRSSADLAWARAYAAPEPMAGADRALRGFLLR